MSEHGDHESLSESIASAGEAIKDAVMEVKVALQDISFDLSRLNDGIGDLVELLSQIARNPDAVRDGEPGSPVIGDWI